MLTYVDIDKCHCHILPLPFLLFTSCVKSSSKFQRALRLQAQRQSTGGSVSAHKPEACWCGPCSCEAANFSKPKRNTSKCIQTPPRVRLSDAVATAGDSHWTPLGRNGLSEAPSLEHGQTGRWWRPRYERFQPHVMSTFWWYRYIPFSLLTLRVRVLTLSSLECMYGYAYYVYI